ncbi:ribonuclease E activity regulator RraA [Zoogloea sp.]|jgi:regulator of ribonuclease activity A|uniref:ribonuclease E activity regulator RraA n=1 Tax=Zoogloea sp. TaxID=49181 RepID=UPI001AC5E8CF|nr:ribonuclease E activity regulator RraA [Zoogloea sp.]MBK6654568.1 ribonuclease E activity regulator RraA [Zoogloea sp.]MBK7846717.1 ribonuclease E activity regulator RraA [Zoogloea sp.]MBN8282377.1 ribonuclease E activity regulator RraA [Zoogloea sp.]MBP7443666.1 ribonuclease E activity regulator RraA [Zoogloea sp.]HOY00005.1 ribonuclease E activity regulator RraA [Zoogloea sp.]
MEFQTTDLCDANEGKVRAVAPMFRSFGGKTRFSGPVRTLKVFEDNALVRSTLETPGNGAVLVVDAGGSTRCAMLGDQLALLGVKNGWSGVIMYGCIRDSGPISGMDLGVFALGTHPMKSVKKGAGDLDIPVSFGGVTFSTGQYVYADEDGVIVSEAPLL